MGEIVPFEPSRRVIQLEQFRQGVRSPTGAFFPTVYRVSGSHYRDDGDAIDFDNLVPDPSYPIREYSLSPEATSRVANLVCDPITRLDPLLDSGWVIVRHHPNLDSAQSYLDGLEDCDDGIRVFRRQWQTPDGIFSLYHRPARIYCRDCLLVYGISPMPVGFPPIDPWCHIVASDGSVFSDEDVLLPPEIKS